MMLIRLARLAHVCLLAVLGCAAAVLANAAAASLGDADTSLKVSISNTGTQSLRSSPVTFGEPFRQGDFPQGVRVSASGESLPAQVDVKRRYADGSLRFAVITAMPDELVPGQALQIELSPAPATAAPAAAIAPSDLLKHGFDAVVTFRFPDGAVRTVRARKLLEREGSQARTWLRGPVATEWLLVGGPEDEQGKADEDLCVRFQVWPG